jgi:L-rhamnose mutarotase
MNRRMLAVGLAGSILTSGCAVPGPRTGDVTDVVEPVYGPTNPTLEEQVESGVRRFGSVIELRPEHERRYRELHADVWPEVRAAIEQANIRNYSIHAATIDGRRYLFSYFEYVGTDLEKDFASMAEDSVTRDRWWPLTDACQRVIAGTPEGAQWLSMELLMHIE